MKKNILLVPSLLLLPLLTATPLLGMAYKDKQRPSEEKSRKQRRQINKQNTEKKEHISFEDLRQRMMAELETSAVFQNNHDLNSSHSSSSHDDHRIVVDVNEYHPIAVDAIEVTALPTINHEPTNTTSTSSSSLPINTIDVNDYNQFPFLAELIEDLGGGEPYIVEKTNSNALLQSVMLPTEAKGLGVLGTFSYYLKNSITNIISYLEQDTFDVKNASHFNLLNEAIEKAAANNDVDALAIIAALCNAKEEYKVGIRISDAAAQPAFTSLSTKYTAELNRSQKTLTDNYQDARSKYNTKTTAFLLTLNNAITTYRQDIQNINDNYDTSVTQELARIATMKKQISEFGNLNKSIRENAVNILTTNSIEIPKNKFPNKMKQTHTQLNIMATLSNKMPILKELDNK